MFRFILASLGLLLCCTNLFSQKDYSKYKFGTVTDGDREMTVAPIDSSAEAYVLFDQLRLEVLQTSEGRPILHEYRHRQVKLLRESAFGRADIEIVYNRDNERVSSIKAVIHLPDGSSEKIPKREIIRERYDDDRDIYKFTFPGVTAGAIIEYAYLKTDEYITVPSRYYFQEDIPVRWAEYRASIPEYFNYVSLSNASKYTVSTSSKENREFGGKQISHSISHWAYSDLEPYTDQPYVNNFNDYVPHIRLQLASVRYPGQTTQKVFSDWPTVVKDLDGYTEFGKAYRNRGLYNKVWSAAESSLTGATTELEKATALYNFVAGKISWNGDYSILSNRTPNKVLDAAEGTSGEMGIMLLALLTEAGIEAQPVLVPLRNTGTPIELYPLMAQFRHVMVLATLDGKPTFLDPNDISRPPGLPRFSALNHRAFVAETDNPHWIDLSVPKATQTIMATVILDEEGMADVDIKSRLSSYYGFTGRNRIEEMEGDADLPIVISSIKMFPELEVISHEVAQEDVRSGPLKYNLQMKVPMGQRVDDFLYVQPILCPVLDKALADVETRLYPVDFGYPWTERYVTTITIPEGYAVDELPESIRLKSEDGAISATMAASDKGDGTISLNFTVSILRTIFQPQEYAVLQDMFRRIIEMQESTIVLKKTK
jgi:hypothetical protein